MRSTFVVVDDFYDDPDDVHDRALQRSYRRPEGAFYPGLVSATPDDIKPAISTFSRLLGVDVKYRGEGGAFRVAIEADMATRRSLVHVDSADFSAVVHLSKHDSGGTYFWRHKALGLDRVSEEDIRNPEVRVAIARDTLAVGAWEQLHTIPMKYNRLVVFDCKHFHSSPVRLPGHTLAEGRITQNFFFDRSEK